jgi:hypothetical protein
MPPVGIQADWKRFNLPATITIYRPVHVHITSVTENQNAREDEASVSSPEQQLGNENPPTDEEGAECLRTGTFYSKNTCLQRRW